VSSNASSSCALEAERVWFAYGNRNWILRDLSLAVPARQHTVIMGPSGAGKTTLLRLLCGVIKPARGKVTVFGESVHALDRRRLSALVGYIPQQLGLVRNLSALDNVLMGALGRIGDAKALLGLFSRQELERAEAMLDLMDMLPKRNEPVFRLSGGQRQRVAIARTLLQAPRVVIADEFASDLDLALASEILARLKSAAARENITFIMSMHRHGLARQFGEAVLELSEGAILPALLDGEIIPERIAGEAVL